MPDHLTSRPLLAALLLCSAQAAHLTVLDSPDPVALNVLRTLARLLPDPPSGVPVTCPPERGPAVRVVTDLLGYATCPVPAGTMGATTVRVQGPLPCRFPRLPSRARQSAR